MEGQILKAEQRLTEASSEASDPAVAADSGEVSQRYLRLDQAQSEVDTLYSRWAELEEKRHGNA